jgi:hypothetical protein
MRLAAGRAAPRFSNGGPFDARAPRGAAGAHSPQLAGDAEAWARLGDLAPETEAAIEMHRRTSRPWGDAAFVEATEHATGRTLAPQWPARKPGGKRYSVPRFQALHVGRFTASATRLMIFVIRGAGSPRA